MSGRRPSVKLGVVLLCHSDLPMAQNMARIWADGGASVAIHVDAKANAQHYREMLKTFDDRPEITFTRRHHCDWGSFNLVRATQDAAEQLLQKDPTVTHVFLASGSCLPLRPVAELSDYLARFPGRDFIESVAVDDVFWAIGGLNEERFSMYFPFDWRRHRRLFDAFCILQRRLGLRRRLPERLVPHLGSQWWCLTRETLQAILTDPRRAEFDRYFRLTWIPDEGYFQTLARRHSPQIESRSLTLARFDSNGRPYLLYDDHLQMLEDSGCFVARKVWPGVQQLLTHFPAARSSVTRDRQPEPVKIEQMFERAATRHLLGRPGLYMQSRFPRKDRENGKTSAPYAVFQGFSDIFPDFERWLADRINGDVHGHLLGPEGAEFAGRPKVGPGALSANAELRDHDPQGFLTSLIRVTNRLQAFQFGPRDNQELTWFIATDPNASLSVITGAWLLPLQYSEMPFDDIRRIAAILQRAEVEQFKILNSVWVKARVKVWSLSEALADPGGVLAEALAQIDPLAPSPKPHDLPGMRDCADTAYFLHRLRNAGLRPVMTGDFPLPDLVSDRKSAP